MGVGDTAHWTEKVGLLVTVQTKGAEAATEWVALGGEGRKGTHCGHADSHPSATHPLPGMATLSGGGWLLLGVDYSLKCCLGPMLLRSAEIPFCSNEISVRMLERRKPFN